MNSAKTKKIDIKIKEEEQVFNPEEKEYHPEERVIESPKTSAVHKTMPLEIEGLGEGEHNLVNPTLEDDLGADAVSTKPEKVKMSVLMEDLPTNVKVMYWFLIIFTFGYFSKVVRDRIEENVENVLNTSNEIPFNMKIFMNALGEAENISLVESTISSVKITFRDINKVDKDKIKQLSKRGILVSDKMTILFGNFSETLKQQIEAEVLKAAVTTKTVKQQTTETTATETSATTAEATKVAAAAAK